MYDHDYDRAIIQYTRAIKLDFSSANYYYWRGRAYYQKGDYSKAFEDVSMSLFLDPKYTESYSLKELCLDKLNEQYKKVTVY